MTELLCILFGFLCGAATVAVLAPKYFEFKLKEKDNG